MAIAVARTKAVYRAGATVPVGSPNPRQYVLGENGLPTFTGNGSGSTVTWSDGGAGGAFAPAVTANGVATTYTPLNRTKAIVITGTDTATPANIGTTTLQVNATQPLNPVADYDTDSDQDTEVSKARDKSEVRATFGPVFDTTPLQWIGRHYPQWRMMRDFWDYHTKVIPFYFVDQETLEMYLVTYESALRQKKRGSNQFDMSATIKGAR